MGRGVRRLVRVDLRVPAVSDPCSYFYTYHRRGEQMMDFGKQVNAELDIEFLEKRVVELERKVDKLTDLHVRMSALVVEVAADAVKLDGRVVLLE